MESGRVTGFFRNAPFDKPGVLQGFLGFRPPFFITPLTLVGRGGVWGLSGGGTTGADTRSAGIKRCDAGPAIFFNKTGVWLNDYNPEIIDGWE